LYLVPTPIGNLEDITLRALRVLREADLVVCEDTRQTVKLLNHYQIQKPLLSFYTYNQRQRIPHIAAELEAGKTIALVSDSGTPGISDPGYFMVQEALARGIAVVSLPGPSAAVTALVASGLPSDGYVFAGFLKRKAGKLKKELAAAAAAGRTIIFYESPYRVKKTLALCREVFPGDTRVVLARELTKKFEEYIRGTLDEVSERVRDRDLLGEFVVLIAPTGMPVRPATEDDGDGEQS
jgi:16S rRNA (cytidine1402-2'-O)-methyltransferase